MHSVWVGNKNLGAVALTVLGAACGVTSAHSQESTSDAAPDFAVWEYRVLGNTLLSNVTVERAVYQFLGAKKTIADVEQARQALEKTYRDAGYGTVFVDIPEQNVDEGTVRLRVTESRLDRVRITGARYYANGDIRAALPALVPGEPPNLPALQSQLAALNQVTADRVVIPVLKAGRTPGTVDVELKVDDELPVHGSLEVNDRYSADTSRLRASGSLSYNNLFQRHHTLSLQYQTAPEEPDDVGVIVGSYVFRVPGLSNLTLAAYAVDSQTDVATLGALSVIGNGQIYGLRAIQALPAHDRWLHNVSYGLDFKDFTENIRLDEEAELLTPIQYLNWSVVYSATRAGERSRNVFSLGANFGVRRLANAEKEFSEKRFKGDPNYFYLRASADHLQRLPLGLALYGRFAGQFTQTPLVSNEQFALGGADTVRGYLESTQLADYGANATLELRSASPLDRIVHAPAAAYIAAFVDAGISALLEPLPKQDSKFVLASAGVGLRIDDWYGFELALDWAYPLKDAGRIEEGEDRVHFSVRHQF